MKNNDIKNNDVFKTMIYKNTISKICIPNLSALTMTMHVFDYTLDDV